MLQRSYSNYIKKQRFEKKKKKLDELFLREGVYDEIKENARKVEVSDFSVSIVSAVYNAENEIDEFVRSIVNQSVSFKRNFELILVDDGSIDGSWQKCIEWTNNYPDNIFSFKKENGGVASARNYGLKKASKKWVTFIDPDDFVNQKYFESVYEVANSKLCKPDLIVCKMIVYRPDSYEVGDTHPLTYKFKEGALIIEADSCPEYAVQLSASSCLFKRELISNNGLVFNNIKPSFEDGFFVNEYLLRSNRVLALVPNAHYFYRKKQNSTSLIGTAWFQKEKFNEQLVWYKSLLDLSVKIDGKANRWIEYVIAYDLMWHFRYLVGNENRISFLSNDEKILYKDLLKDLLGHLDSSCLAFLEKRGLGEFYSEGMKTYFKNELDDFPLISIVGYDKDRQLAKFRFFSHDDFGVLKIFSSLGHEVDVLYHKIKKTNFLNDVFLYEVSGWFPIKGIEFLRFFYEKNDVKVKIGRRPNANLQDGVFSSNIVRFYKKQNINSKKLEPVKRAYRRISNSRFCKQYEKCWLLMDRDTQADDNAEHFYRYLSKSRNENIWFVLRKSSLDWNRLKREGFKLIEYGSIKHKLAMLRCEFLISSHADEYITDLMPKKYYGDILNYKFVFLQHGVIKHDMSSWLNGKSIDLFVTSTQGEYDSIAGDHSSYNLTSKEVALTGLPRHDALHNKCKKDEVKRILVMPTWRKGIVGKVKGRTNDRHYNDFFVETEYFLKWNEFISSPLLKKVSDSGVEIILFLHANIEQYVNEFDTSNVKVVRHGDVSSVQDLFVDSDLMITDYSSVAFEMAFLEKPVLYYQFDKETVYGKDSLYMQGYFDFFDHGFGPVVTEKDKLEESVIHCLGNNFLADKEYVNRMKITFPYEKGKACERVYQKIVERRP